MKLICQQPYYSHNTLQTMEGFLLIGTTRQTPTEQNFVHVIVEKKQEEKALKEEQKKKSEITNFFDSNNTAGKKPSTNGVSLSHHQLLSVRYLLTNIFRSTAMHVFYVLA